MNITKSEVRKDFSHVRMLMQMADKMLRQNDIDYSLGSEFEQLSLELIGSAHTLNAYIEQRRAARVQCDECEVSFNMKSPYDAQQWSIAHKCEQA